MRKRSPYGAYDMRNRLRQERSLSRDRQKIIDKQLYPKPTKYQQATAAEMRRLLARGGDDAEAVRTRLLARMGDISEFMKAVKQRFSVWYNRTHDRYGTLWAERFKSVLVEGEGNPLQTMAAYIDLNPIRGGLVEDPKNDRFCGYAEAVAGHKRAKEGLWQVWADRIGGQSGPAKRPNFGAAMEMHRMFLFGKGAEWGDLAVIQGLRKQVFS